MNCCKTHGLLISLKTFFSSLSLAVFVLFSGLSLSANATEQKVVELLDGSKLYGEIVGFSGGVYTVQTTSLGMIKIEESRIRSIQFKPASSAVNQPQVEPGQINQMMTRITSDRNVMRLISSLREDPDFQAVLNDPEVMNAISSGNYDALFSNPRIQSLMQNEKVKSIQNKVLK